MKRRYWLLGGIVLMVIAIGAGVRLVSAPSHGKMVTSKASLESKKTPQANLPSTTIESDYFQLTLPAGYRPQSAQTVPGLLFAQTLTKPSLAGSLIINIGIKSLAEGGLAGESSYRLREQQTDRYSLTSQVINGDLIFLANDAQSAAVVAFWPHGSYLATISVSSGVSNPSPDDNAAELAALEPLLKAWQWR